VAVRLCLWQRRRGVSVRLTACFCPKLKRSQTEEFRARGRDKKRITQRRKDAKSSIDLYLIFFCVFASLRGEFFVSLILVPAEVIRLTPVAAEERAEPAGKLRHLRLLSAWRIVLMLRTVEASVGAARVAGAFVLTCPAARERYFYRIRPPRYRPARLSSR